MDCGDDFELLARGGAVDVDRDQHGAVAALFEPGGEFAGGGGFAGALQAGHQDDGRRLGGEFEARGVVAEGRHQLVADDFDDLLGGLRAVATSVPRALARIASISLG